MKGISRLIPVFILFIVSCGPAKNKAEINSGKSTNKIAFISGGEVRVTNRGCQEMEQITETGGKVESFLFSPWRKYLAYSRITGYMDEPGLWDDADEVPQRAVCSIVITEFESRKEIREITPDLGGWIYHAKWTSLEKLLLYNSSGFDISGFEEYDVRNDIRKELNYNDGSRLFEADVDGGGMLVAYISDTKTDGKFMQNIRLYDLKSGEDKILAAKKSILEPKISNDKEKVAFIEVEWDHAKSSGSDNLWIYDIKKASLKKIYTGPSKPKIAGVAELVWSDDDRHIGMFFSPKALAVDTADLSNIYELSGTDFSWLGNKEIIFTQGSSIYTYSLDDRKRELFMENASKPAVLK